MREEHRWRTLGGKALLPSEQLTLPVILSPADLAAGKASIEHVERRGASFATGRPIRYPDNNGG